MLFLGLGLDLEVKNSRYHTAFDLTSNKDIKDIITKALETKNCNICSKQFGFHVHQFVCKICTSIICEKCCVSEYYFETVNDKDKDLLECRCSNCYNRIKEHENKLIDAIRSNDLERIVEEDNQIKINNINIDCKLSAETKREITRLETEKKIAKYLDSLKVVDNHKTIIKSVSVLEDMLELAKKQNIKVDQSVLDYVDADKKRLLAEKELRYFKNNELGK